MRFIHTADVHLGMEPDKGSGWSQERKIDIEETFRNIVSLCEQKRVDFLFIAGDLFHRQPFLRELKEWNSAFRGLSRTNVIIIAGNHDYLRQQSQYLDFHWADNVYLLGREGLETITFAAGNTQITGFSYEKRDIREYRYDSVKPADKQRIQILLAHGGDEKNVPIHWDHVTKSGFDYLAFGHIHKPQKIGDYGYYAGSPEPLDRTETGKHGVVYGEIIKKEGVIEKRDLMFLPVSKREYFDFSISVTKDELNNQIFEKCLDKIHTLGEKNIFSFRISGKRESGFILDCEGIKRLGNVISVLDETEPDYDFKQLYQEHSGDMIGRFIYKVQNMDLEDETKKQVLYAGMEALLKGVEE